jgi:hypothetical protein
MQTQHPGIPGHQISYEMGIINTTDCKFVEDAEREPRDLFAKAI